MVPIGYPKKWEDRDGNKKQISKVNGSKLIMQKGLTISRRRAKN